MKRLGQLESGVWRSLFAWIRRRPIGVEPGDQTFGYAAAAGPALWTMVVVCSLEIPLVHFLVPGFTARVVFLVAGAWGLVWMVGFLASWYVHPHLVRADELRIRNTMLTDLPVPRSYIESVRREQRSPTSSKTVQLDEDGRLHVVVAGMTNLEIRLAEPLMVTVPKRGETQVTVVRFYADDPTAMIAALRQSEPAR